MRRTMWSSCACITDIMVARAELLRSHGGADADRISNPLAMSLSRRKCGTPTLPQTGSLPETVEQGVSGFDAEPLPSLSRQSASERATAKSAPGTGTLQPMQLPKVMRLTSLLSGIFTKMVDIMQNTLRARIFRCRSVLCNTCTRIGSYHHSKQGNDHGSRSKKKDR